MSRVETTHGAAEIEAKVPARIDLISAASLLVDEAKKQKKTNADKDV